MQFFLLGDQSSSRDIEVDANGSISDLQGLVAAHFAIVEPKGKRYQDSGASLPAHPKSLY